MPGKSNLARPVCVHCFALLPPFCLFCNRWNPTILHSIGHAESADIASGLNLASKTKAKKMLPGILLLVFNTTMRNLFVDACHIMPSLDLKPSWPIDSVLAGVFMGQ